MLLRHRQALSGTSCSSGGNTRWCSGLRTKFQTTADYKYFRLKTGENGERQQICGLACTSASLRPRWDSLKHRPSRDVAGPRLKFTTMIQWFSESDAAAAHQTSSLNLLFSFKLDSFLLGCFSKSLFPMRTDVSQTETSHHVCAQKLEVIRNGKTQQESEEVSRVWGGGVTQRVGASAGLKTINRKRVNLYRFISSITSQFKGLSIVFITSLLLLYTRSVWTHRWWLLITHLIMFIPTVGPTGSTATSGPKCCHVRFCRPVRVFVKRNTQMWILNHHTVVITSLRHTWTSDIISVEFITHEWRRSRARGLLPEGCWFDSPGLHDDVSLSEILNHKLVLTCWSAPSVCECVCELLSVTLDYRVCAC